MNEIENKLTDEQAKEYFLKTANTKHLLALFKSINNEYSYYSDCEYESMVEVSFMAKGGINYKIELTKNELKPELSKREHIPNSVESRRLRQKLAKKYRKGFQGKKDKQR